MNAGSETREYQAGGYKDRFLSVTIRCYVQDEEDAEILQLLQAQHQHLTQMFQQELQLASEEGGS